MGAALGQPNTAEFGVSEEMALPTVEHVRPVDSTTVDIEFSKPVDAALAGNPSSYEIRDEGGHSLQVLEASALEDGVTVRLTTATQSSGWYVIRTDGVADTFGNPADPWRTSGFEGIPDVVPPQVVSVGAPGVLGIDLVFSEPVEVTSASYAGNYLFSCEDGALISVTEAALLPDGQTVRLLAATPLHEGWCTVSVSGVRDLVGNTSSLSTVGFFVPDTTPPTAAEAAWIDSAHVDLVFSEPVEVTSGSYAGNYLFSCEDGALVSVTEAALLPDGQTVRLLAATPLHEGWCTVSVSGVRDLVGNASGLSTVGFFVPIGP